MEKINFCVKCGGRHDEKVVFCIECGAPLKSEKFCMECGMKLGNDATFCVECGTNQVQTKVDATVKPIKVEKLEKVKQPEMQLKKPLSRKSKVMLGIGAVLIVVGVGVNYYLQQYFDPKKQVLKMHEAFSEEDKETFYSYFEFPENTNGTAEQFYNWIAEEDWSNIREEMLEQLEREENGIGADPIWITYDDALYMSKEDVLFGLYEKIAFNIKPLDVSIYMPISGTEVKIAGEKVITSEEPIMIGKFIFGDYTYEYNFEGPYMPITGKGEVKISSYNTNQTVEELEMEYESVNLYSNYEDAVIYINDKSTNKTISEINSLQPVRLDDEVKIHLVAKNLDGKEILSSSHSLNESDIHFKFEGDIQMALVENAKKFYNLFRSNYVNAIDYIDFSYVSDYFSESEQISKDYKKFVEDHSYISGYRYDFISNEVTDVKVISNSEIELYSTEKFNYYSDEDGGLSYVREKRYKIYHENGEFKIKEIKDLNTIKQKI